MNIFYVGFNNKFAPFDDEKVRQAIAMGIDRQRIVDNFYPPGSTVASHFTPCDIPGGCSGDEWYAFDPTAAKQMLVDAGFDFDKTYPLSLRDVVRGYLPQPVVVATEIQSQLLTNLGIKIEIDVRDENTYLTEASRGELEGLHLLGWGADYPDVTNFLDVHFGVGASDQFGTKLDDITGPLVEGAATADPAARETLYAERQQRHPHPRPDDPDRPRRLGDRLPGRRRRGPFVAARQRGPVRDDPGRPGSDRLAPER